MKAICVDDEKLILDHIVSVCEEMPLIDEVYGFSRALDALEWCGKNFADVALLDIDMPDMNGIKLAAKIKGKSPDTKIIFSTGYSEYAVEAFKMHVSGYLLKPVSKERVFEEIEYALSDKAKANITSPEHISVQTFGEFDVYVDGEPILFARSKAKELLAYLVDKQGHGIKRADAFAILWEKGEYDRSAQKQLDVIIRSLKDTLKENGISDIFEIKGGVMRVLPERFDCDLYRFFKGDTQTINSYRGQYMSAYRWANMTEGYTTLEMQKNSGQN